MNELKVDFYDTNLFPDIIYFKADFHWFNKSYFQVNKNFKITRSLNTSRCDYLNLKYNLDLKYFKIEVF